jgi:hypothetical protein
MKMDFPHLADANPAERGRARYAALVACAANGQLRHIWQGLEISDDAAKSDQLDGLYARIGYFSKNKDPNKDLIFGAFLPEPANRGMVDEITENTVNLAASVIGKPNFLGSRYPGDPETLRGMEN